MNRIKPVLPQQRSYLYSSKNSKVQQRVCETEQTVDYESKSSLPLLQRDDRWIEIKFKGKNILGRSHHVAVIHQQYLYVYGGSNPDEGILGDFYRLHLLDKEFIWEVLPTEGQNYPGKLKCQSGVVFNNSLWMFGGERSFMNSNNITYVCNLTNRRWKCIKPSKQIPGLQSHQAVIHQQAMYVFGGYIADKAIYSSSIYKLDCLKETWSICNQKGKKPMSRANFSLAYSNGDAWLFGGSNGIDALDDLWKFNFGSQQWIEIKCTKSPCPRKGSIMVCYDQNLYIFGGIQSVTRELNDLWAYDPKQNNWIELHSNSNFCNEFSPTSKLNTKKSKLIQSSKDRRMSLANYQKRVSTPSKQSPDIIMRKILNDNKLKKFQQRKRQLLKEFRNTKTQMERPKSPVTENLAKLLKNLGTHEESKIHISKDLRYNPSNRTVVGKRPYPRDGHSGCVFGQSVVIFGGDRHMLCFNDIYLLDLGRCKTKPKPEFRLVDHP